nr:MAG TPA: hypothetical protein [Siphoviridae sp. ctHdl3]
MPDVLLWNIRRGTIAALNAYSAALLLGGVLGLVLDSDDGVHSGLVTSDLGQSSGDLLLDLDAVDNGQAQLVTNESVDLLGSVCIIGQVNAHGGELWLSSRVLDESDAQVVGNGGLTDSDAAYRSLILAFALVQSQSLLTELGHLLQGLNVVCAGDEQRIVLNSCLHSCYSFLIKKFYVNEPCARFTLFVIAPSYHPELRPTCRPTG